MIEMIKDGRPETAWITARIDGRMVQAKVFNKPSHFGINGGRISKLHVSKEGHDRMGLSDACYNYDRGLDFDNDGAGVVPDIISQLESLPLCEDQP